MNPGWWVWVVLALAIAVLGLGGRKLFRGRPTGWPGAGLIVVVGISALIVALAIILALVFWFLCHSGPCF